MSDNAPTDPAKLQRRKRLEETLKENLRRRKMQARARAGGTPDDAAPKSAEDEPAGG